MPEIRNFPLRRCPVCRCHVSCTGMCAQGCRMGMVPAGKKRSPKWPALVLLVVAAVLAGTFLGLAVAPHISDPAPLQISPDSSETGLYSYEQIVRANVTLIPITASASAQVYSGAMDAASLCYGSFDTYYPVIISDPAQDDFFADLLQQFRAIRGYYRLDDDQYAELMAAYVQAIPYDRNASQAVKYPVVTAVGGTGDCDDLSLLLAGLLEREGYDVSLLLYLDSGHMAVGIRTDDASAFPNTGGYAYIETTGGMLFVCGDHPMGMIDEAEVPGCIRIGNGTKTYTAGTESDALFSYLSAAYYADGSAEGEPLVLNSPEPAESSEELEMVAVNAFDRDYLYRTLIEGSA